MYQFYAQLMISSISSAHLIDDDIISSCYHDYTDAEQAKLLEERYKTTIVRTPPEFVKPLPAVCQIQPGEVTRYAGYTWANSAIGII